MAGISGYYHGEYGILVDRRWIVDPEGLMLQIQLEGNPHRRFAYSWGSDVGIDPTIRLEQGTVYLRLDEYAGIWVEGSCQTGSPLDAALERVRTNNEFLLRHVNRIGPRGPWIRCWSALIKRKTGIPVQVKTSDRDWVDTSGRPATPLTIFLSYSSSNVILARHIYQDLSNDAKADVWLDLTQSADSPNHQQHIDRWLQKAVYDSRVFVVLLTRRSLESAWVKKEITWAREKALKKEDDFHLVVLKLDDIPIPKAAKIAKYVIDCEQMHLWGVSEALYAAVYSRQTRREWLTQNPKFKVRIPDWDPVVKDPYFMFDSDAGIAISLEWNVQFGRASWTLEYKDARGRLKTVKGPTRVKNSAPDREMVEDIVDPGIRPGDKIGCGRVHNYRGWPCKVWMRSQDMNLSFSAVVDAYEGKLREPRKTM